MKKFTHPIRKRTSNLPLRKFTLYYLCVSGRMEVSVRKFNIPFLGLGLIFIVMGIYRLYEKNYVSAVLFILAAGLELLAAYSFGNRKNH